MSPTADGASTDLQQAVADLQRQLAEARAERDESEAQKAALAEILQIINSSPGDLAPVFDAILEKAHRLCGIAQGSLELYDGERFQAVAVRGLSETFADLLRQGYPASDNPATRPLIEGERFSYIADMAKSDYSIERTAAEAERARTLLCVPLRREGQLLGMIASARREVRPFSEKETALLENFAAQAVIAMENARLLTEQREALERQTATAEVLQVINASPGDLIPVFDAILEKAHRLCGVHRGSLQLFDGDRFRAVATRFPPDAEAFVQRLRRGYPASDTPVLQPLRGGVRFVHVPDLAEVDDAVARSAVAAGTRSILYVPLRRDDAFLGMIVASREEVRPFSEKEIALLENFAAQAVIAMENARLLGDLRQRTDEVVELNRGLEVRVAQQVEELGRVGRLKRFLAPQLAEMIVSQGDEKILESHRREIVVVFCDLRGYTAFTETAEPEEVLGFLREYHGALGPLVSQFEGTLDQFSGDGIMVFFNDPVPIPDPAERAVKMAVAMREAASTMVAAWRARGRELGFGVGVAQGYATLGQIGFSERSGYTAIGTVCNVAARLCSEAKDGQILLSQLVNVALNGSVATEQVGALVLKGLTQPVVAYNVPLTASQPALRVIDGGNH